MAAQLYVNNFKTTLGSSLVSGATTATLASGTGVPAVAGGDWWLLTITEGANIEIIKVTSATGGSSTLTTIVRQQEGTTSPASFTTAAVVEGRLTKGTMDALAPKDSPNLLNMVIISGYSQIAGASNTASGHFYFGTNGSYQGLFDYDASGSTKLTIKNTYSAGAINVDIAAVRVIAMSSSQATFNVPLTVVNGSLSTKLAASGTHANEFHAPNASPFVLSLFNDTYSSTIPGLQAYVYNDGTVSISSPAAKEIRFAVNGYTGTVLSLLATGEVSVANEFRTSVGIVNVGYFKTSKGTAPTGLGHADAYLSLGNVEYGADTYRAITFGYKSTTNQPAAIAYQEKTSSGQTSGDIVILTRNGTTDAAPTEVARFKANQSIVFTGPLTARVNPREQTTASAATVTPNADTDDLVTITAQAAGLTLANPSGTPVQGQPLIIRIKDNGTARSISFGTQYRAMGHSLPTTTVISKTLYLGLRYNSTDTKWDLVALAQEA